MRLWCYGTVQLLMIYEGLLLSRLLRKVVSFLQGQINLPKVKSISRKKGFSPFQPQPTSASATPCGRNFS